VLRALVLLAAASLGGCDRAVGGAGTPPPHPREALVPSSTSQDLTLETLQAFEAIGLGPGDVDGIDDVDDAIDLDRRTAPVEWLEPGEPTPPQDRDPARSDGAPEAFAARH
jgi:hypothetical protein